MAEERRQAGRESSLKMEIIMGMTTLYLAVSNPDYLVVDDQQYNEIKSDLRAQAPPETGQTDQEAPPDRDDGAN